MEITVKIKAVYGRDLVYPLCPKAICFANVAGTDTLTESTIMWIKKLGYRIKVQSTTEL